MHLGSLESTQDARVALGYRLEQFLSFFFFNNLITFTMHYIKRYSSLQTAQLLTLLNDTDMFQLPTEHLQILIIV